MTILFWQFIHGHPELHAPQLAWRVEVLCKPVALSDPKDVQHLSVVILEAFLHAVPGCLDSLKRRNSTSLSSLNVFSIIATSGSLDILTARLLAIWAMRTCCQGPVWIKASRGQKFYVSNGFVVMTLPLGRKQSIQVQHEAVVFKAMPDMYKNGKQVGSLKARCVGITYRLGPRSKTADIHLRLLEDHFKTQTVRVVHFARFISGLELDTSWFGPSNWAKLNIHLSNFKKSFKHFWICTTVVHQVLTCNPRNMIWTLERRRSQYPRGKNMPPPEDTPGMTRPMKARLEREQMYSCIYSRLQWSDP